MKLELIGNLGADVVLRENDRGKYLTFDVAHTDVWRDPATSERVERTDWVSCSYNGGERVAQYLVKGARVYVRGRLSLRCYRTQAGDWRAAANVFCDEVVLCGGGVSDKQGGDAPF